MLPRLQVNRSPRSYYAFVIKPRHYRILAPFGLLPSLGIGILLG